MNSSNCCEKWAPCARAVLRIIVGLLFLQHGTQKLFGWPIAGPAQLDTLMTVGAWLEFVGGVLMVLGLFTRPVAFILCGEMAVAYFTAHHRIFSDAIPKSSPIPLMNHGELAVVYCFVFFYFIFAGAGSASLDKLMCCGKCGGKGGDVGGTGDVKVKP
ncbi:MAG: DoxX family protein [Limisphaerales bacterium]